MKKLNFIAILVVAMMVILLLMAQPASALNLTITEDGLVVAENVREQDARDSWNEMLLGYRGFLMGFFAIATTSTVMLFIFSFIRLGSAGSNPSERSKALSHVMWTGIGTALLGATFLLFGMSYNMI